jgi:hypothetical protein
MRKNNIMKRDPLKVEITEMFMAQADHDRCFYGIIKRSKDANGNPHVFSRIKINGGMIQACAGDQKTLGKMLDEMCKMVLDGNLHGDKGKTIIIAYPSHFTIPFSFEINRMFLN